MVLYIVVSNTCEYTHSHVHIDIPHESYQEARSQLLYHLQTKYSDQTFNQGGSIYEFYASRVPESDPSNKEGWLLSSDDWSIWKFHLRPSPTMQSNVFPVKTIERMISIATDHNDMLLSEKLKTAASFQDVHKSNRWFGYFQKVGEERGYWNLEQVISWVREERTRQE